MSLLLDRLNRRDSGIQTLLGNDLAWTRVSNKAKCPKKLMDKNVSACDRRVMPIVGIPLLF